MQKYKRLALVLITCCSIILMYTYRQKYSKLSLIFEMMNAFQYGDSETKCNEKLFAFKKGLNYDFQRQEQIASMPYWTEIFPDIYIYSSYWLEKQSRSLIFARNVQTADLQKIECKLHYEYGKPAINPATKVINLADYKSNIYAYVECIPFNNQVPHSVSFVHKNQTSSTSFPLIHEESYVGQFAACVPPLTPAFSDVNKILEFIIYHSHIGVKLFVFYERGLSLNVRKLLLEFTWRDNINILLLPWNMPFKSETYFSDVELPFIDCFTRVVARNYSDFVLRLEINDFIVYRQSWNINFLNWYDSSIDAFELLEKVFCEEHPNDVIAQNLFMPFVTLLKTTTTIDSSTYKRFAYDVKKSKHFVLTSKVFHNWVLKRKLHNVYRIPSPFAVIHSYKSCGLKTEKTGIIEDRIMWKYKDTFFKSHLYLQAKEANLTYA